MAYLLDIEKQVADVQRDVPADVGVVHEIAHGPFPDTVEVDSYKVAVPVEDGTARIAARRVVGG